MQKKVHHAFGVYGIYTEGTQLLVIRKNDGPYQNRFDLPGGSLENDEGLFKALKREFEEETSAQFQEATQLGTVSFHYPWQYQDFNYNRHIAVFYRIREISGSIAAKVAQFPGQDSLGSLWVPMAKLTLQNASPLVLLAKQYLITGKFSTNDQWFDDWQVL